MVPALRRSAVLGIDAAWTETNVSGVALVEQMADGRWRCVAVAPSYQEFLTVEKRSVNWERRTEGGRPPAEALLQAARRLLGIGASVSLITVDMPLSLKAITGRRAADDEVSRHFGAAGCGTHSPSSIRPGCIANMLRAELTQLGFPLATKGAAGRSPRTLEVYPHPALLALTGRPRRLCYKASRVRSYWKNASAAERIANLIAEWRTIRGRLMSRIDGVLLPSPRAARPRVLKRYEDALDALICAWVGIEYLAGNAVPYGDEHAAVWIPSRRSTRR